MREIGGFIELDTYNLPMLHEDAIALNCGRKALAYLLRARRIRKLYIPKFICESVTRACMIENIPYSLYSIGLDFLPTQEITLGEDEWLYFVNYYSQFENETISKFVEKYHRVIVDNAQSYFQLPIPGVDTIYTCRKYFGVADGAFLYTNAILEDEFPQDESFERMNFLLGRFERTASEFYSEYVVNNTIFTTEPIKRMSKLTWNLLHGVDYKHIKSVRENNYRFLNNLLGNINILELRDKPGSFMYPLYIKTGAEVREKLQKKKVYIPTLWPDVFLWCNKTETEYTMAQNILPLPIDQRYDEETMNEIAVNIIAEI